MHRQREDRLSMCSVLYFNLQPLIARCSGDPSWEELIMPRRHPSLCSPLQFQTASLWCGRAVPGTRAARDCMTVHDGRSGSFMTLYCRKACNHYSSTGQLFQYAADQHINRKHHLFVLPSCPAFIISIFPLSILTDTEVQTHRQTEPGCIYKYSAVCTHCPVSTNTFVPYLHAPKHKQWTCWQTVQCRLQ